MQRQITAGFVAGVVYFVQSTICVAQKSSQPNIDSNSSAGRDAEVTDVLKESIANGFQKKQKDVTEDFFGIAQLESPVSNIVPTAQLFATTSSTRAKISAGYTFSPAQRNPGKLRYDSMLIALSSPISKDPKGTDIATLDGLANSTSLEFTFRRVIRGGAANAQHKLVQMSDAELVDKLFELDELAQKRCLEKADTAARQKACTADTFNHSPYLTPADYYAAGIPLFEENRPTKIYGLTGKIGYEEFSFRDAGTFDKLKEEKIPYSFSAFFGYMPSPAPTIYIIGAEYQRAYKAADSQTLCDTSTIMNGIQECFTGSFAAPVKDNKTLAYFEVRHMFGGGPLGDLGIKVRYTHDFENDVNGVDVPIYLLRNAEKNLTGGVRLGWRDDTDDLTAGVFVGAAFSLFD